MDTVILWLGGGLFAILAVLILHAVYAGRRRTGEIVPTPQPSPGAQES